jgi:membrane protease YdiL (CAAX protease family)
MTTTVAPRPPRSVVDAATTAAVPSVLVAVLGCAALAARGALLSSTRQPSTTLAILFGVLLVVGALAPLPSATHRSRSFRVSLVAVFVGVLAFSAGRGLVGGHAPSRFTLQIVAANTLAAVAEEIWYRRLCFGLLERTGTAFAIGGSSVLFALAHVSMYGFWILPLDLAAGALLGWQRAVTGSWAASAATHAIANLFVVL